MTRGSSFFASTRMRASESGVAFSALTTLVELGPGSGDKLARLAAAVEHEVQVHLVDVSADALEQAALALGVLRHVEVITHKATYETGLVRAVRAVEKNGAAAGRR